MDGFDPQTIKDAGSVATAIALIGVLLRFAIGQADKRATVAESREQICTATLVAVTTTMAALTEEVRKGGEEEVRILKDNNALGRENVRRLDAGLRQLSALQRDIEACVGELRSGR
jgi:hypothetical protein